MTEVISDSCSVVVILILRERLKIEIILFKAC